MHTKLEDWNNGWFGIELGIRPEEIDPMIESLRMLQRDHDQHFHISSDGKGRSGVGDIVVYVQPADEPSNMKPPSSRAFAPGDSIDDSKT